MTATVPAAPPLVEHRPPRLVVPVRPLPGEGMVDLLMRACATNGYTRTVDAMGLVDPLWRIAKSAGTTAAGREALIAQVLGCEDGAAKIEPLVYGKIPGRPGWHLFFGTPLRDVHREVTRRRVSPLGLRRSLHGRAIWTIKALAFDAETGERLLERCPECGRSFTFQRTLGLEFCDQCPTKDAWGFAQGRVDLRDFPQPIVEVADAEALSFVTALVNPQADAVRYLKAGSPFCGIEPGEVFELVYAVACAILADESGYAAGWRPRSREGFALVTPEVLARSGRAILGWPSALHDLLDGSISEKLVRDGHFSMEKALGSYSRLVLDANMPRRLRELVRQAIGQNLSTAPTRFGSVVRAEHRRGDDLVTIDRAHTLFGISKRRLASLAADERSGALRVSGARKAPTLIRRDLIERLHDDTSELIEEGMLARSWGVSRRDLCHLSSRGLIEVEDGLVAYLRGPGSFYRAASTKKLEKRVLRRLDVCLDLDGTACLEPLVKSWALEAESPWADLIEAIVDGRLPALTSDRGRAIHFPRLHVADVALARAAITKQGMSATRHLTQTQAAHLLRTSAVVISDLVRVGLIEPSMTQSQVVEFSKRHILTVEIHQMSQANQLGLRLRDIPSFLRTRGVEPIATLPKAGRRVWSRAGVEKVLRPIAG